MSLSNKLEISAKDFFDSETDFLVSRAQAKKLILEFKDAQQIVLNFEGISEIGQAFADELFRVFQQQHPLVDLSYTHVHENVDKMIRWVVSSKSSKSL